MKIILDENEFRFAPETETERNMLLHFIASILPPSCGEFALKWQDAIQTGSMTIVKS